MNRIHMSTRLALVGLFLCLFGLNALGEDVRAFDYRGGGQGQVTFDHRGHTSKGFTCRDCHTKLPSTGTQLFQTQKQGLISAADHNTDRKCFACHNDKVAFTDCGRCHRK
jgi:c(7)-type cytochrome triheme protein